MRGGILPGIFARSLFGASTMATKTLNPSVASRMSTTEVLRFLQGCEDGIAYAATRTSCFDAYQNCPRVDWLIWLLENLVGLDAVKARLFACWCARETPLAGGGKMWDLLTSPLSRRAVEVAERFARGCANDEERVRAWEDASWVATAAWASGPTPAGSAAAAAAWTVAEVIDARLAADSALTAAGNTQAATKAQVDAVRAIFGNPFLPVGSQRHNGSDRA
jgi:hypothetical protein